jgi:hypothetical protein
MLNVNLNVTIPLLLALLAAGLGGCGEASGPAADEKKKADEIQAAAAGMSEDDLKETIRQYELTISVKQREWDKKYGQKPGADLHKEAIDLQKAIRRLGLNLDLYQAELRKRGSE